MDHHGKRTIVRVERSRRGCSRHGAKRMMGREVDSPTCFAEKFFGCSLAIGRDCQLSQQYLAPRPGVTPFNGHVSFLFLVGYFIFSLISVVWLSPKAALSRKSADSVYRERLFVASSYQTKRTVSFAGAIAPCLFRRSVGEQQGAVIESSQCRSRRKDNSFPQSISLQIVFRS